MILYIVIDRDELTYTRYKRPPENGVSIQAFATYKEAHDYARTLLLDKESGWNACVVVPVDTGIAEELSLIRKSEFIEAVNESDV